uniref:procollagen-lysine 5-dioxygenase n=1 Tax=Culicoides sonorensis TaxID=179676 RepID=A0A336MPH5_CULSO
MNFRLVLLHLFILILIRFYNCENQANLPKVLVFTVASEPNDGYLRYIRSAKHYNIPVTTLGLGQEWKGGDMNSQGGGYKLNLLKDALKPFKNDEETIVLFTDAYDIIFTSSLSEIVEKFKKTEARVLISAENLLWPDLTLKDKYPKFDGPGGWYLNSGMYIGYCNSVYELLKANPIKDTDDDQLYLTNAYLDENLRNKLSIKLDHTSDIFQNLNGAIEQVMLQIDPDTAESFIFNTAFKTRPCVIHGNGPSKVNLNNFGNYLAAAFMRDECKICNENRLTLNEENLPTVLIALFIEKPTPFTEEFLEKVYAQNYPKENLHLFIHSNVEHHRQAVIDFIKERSADYKSFKLLTNEDKYEEKAARSLAVTVATTKKVDYLLSLDSEAHLDNPDTLRKLLEANRTIIAPMLKRDGALWTNFWGALSSNGYYARSTDYKDIVERQVLGVWNVPYITSAYLAKSSSLPKFNFEIEGVDSDMSMCQSLRDANIFMFVTNLEIFGHLIDNEHYDTTLARPDYYQMLYNRKDWEQRYISPLYYEALADNEKKIYKEPCPDVFWFPIATEKFCDDMVAIMENFGKWSDGSNNDERLQGGYEAVPTRDIHMNQVGLNNQWLAFLKDYIRPLQEKIFTGYYHDPPRSLMNFVVRYKPDEQPFLRPHHDSSTYTINIALNHAGIDYEGGGCKFLRYNCSITDTQKGWMLMHPGRLTHFHEGLLVTKGTRYIMISFVDP